MVFAKGILPGFKRDGVLNTITAYIIWCLGLVDRCFHLFVRLREELVLGFIGDRVLQAYAALVYGRAKSYDPGTRAFREDLFDQEREAIIQCFPQPPARLLLGGAGGGREAFCLADMGYSITAFEVSPPLVTAFRRQVETRQLPITVYQGSYQDLCQEGARPDGMLPDRTRLGTFDGVILGWGSFSHLQREERLRLLRVAADLANGGPVLVSYLFRRAGKQRRTKGIRGLFNRIGEKRRRAMGRSVNDRFYPGIGFIHQFCQNEFDELVAEAGLTIRFHTLSGEEKDADHPRYPYAVLSAAAEQTRSGHTALE